MACSMSGQDIPISALWLATKQGGTIPPAQDYKLCISALRITSYIPQENCFSILYSNPKHIQI